MELQFSTMLGVILPSLKADAQVAVFDTKSKAQGLFFQQGGGGSGIIAADTKANVVVVAKLHTGEATARGFSRLSPLWPETRRGPSPRRSCPSPAASSSSRPGSPHGWSPNRRGRRTRCSTRGAPRWKARRAVRCAHEDQKAPVGAFIRVANGEYGFSSSDDVDFAGAGASLLWIRRLG